MRPFRALALLPFLCLTPAMALAQPFVTATDEATLRLNSGTLTLANQQAGAAVAMSADGSRVIVGGPHWANASGTFADIATGRVGIYVRSGTTWTIEATFRGTEQDENMGCSVAMSADGTVALVGALGRNGGRGGASVYRRGAGGWTLETTLAITGAAAFDRGGFSVALSPDGTRALLGAPYDDTARGADAGSAAVFVRGSAGTWAQEGVLLVPNTGAGSSLFGSAVAISDSSAPTQWLVVGAPGDALPSGAGGAAYLFFRSGSSWGELGRLFDDHGGSGDRLGVSVAIDASATNVLAGASDATVGTSALAGRAVHFAQVGSAWLQRDTLVSSTPASSQLFGNSVSLSSDGRRALVGVPREDRPGGSVPGAAHLFLLSGTTYVEDVVLRPSTTQGDEAGRAVAISGDGTRAVVGLPSADPSAMTEGSAHVFRFATGLGAPCASGTECGSGFCADGVCCNVACTRGAGTECRACVATRTGVSNGTCAPITAGTTCAASTGACDPVHVCDGTSNACPTGLLPVGTTCRAGHGTCDPEERCQGGADCPADVRLPNGTSCANADACDGAETCTSGQCLPGAPLDCDDGLVCTADACDALTGCAHTPISCDDADACTADACDPTAGCGHVTISCDDADACTADTCDPATGCAHGPVAGCCNVDLDCDDGDPCTEDTCSGPGATCMHPLVCDGGVGEDAAVGADAAVGGDAGVVTGDAGTRDASAPDGSIQSDGAIAGSDAGTGAPPQNGGCGCRAAGTGASSTAGTLAALLALSWIARRRRR